ncbi:MAG: hypothetical protein AAF245_01450 [Pseudomonadota bacterium]
MNFMQNSLNLIDGTNGDDDLLGTPDADRMRGFFGNDILNGRKGNDVLLGGNGSDKLVGGKGRDLLEGGSGEDLLLGGSGNDTLRGDQGDDTLQGGMGADELMGGAGNDLLIGGLGNDPLNTPTNRLLFSLVKSRLFRLPLSESAKQEGCAVCEMSLKELKRVWDDKDVEAKVESALKGVCQQLGQYSAVCSALVDQYWSTIVQLVDEKLSNPEAACAQLHLCSASSQSLQAVAEAADLTPMVVEAVKLVARVLQTEKAGVKVGCGLCTLAFTTVESAMLQGSLLQVSE